MTDVAGHTTSGKIENAIQLNRRLAAGILADPTVGFGPLTVQFVNRTIGNAEKYLWDFGDGTTSTEKNPTHTYTEPGRYSVSLTSSGPDGSNTEAVAGLIEVYDDMEHLGLTYLKLVDATGETWSGEGWDNAVDQNTFHHWATTNVRGDHPWAVFTFDDGFARKISKVRMLNDTGVEGKEADFVKAFTVLISMDGQNFTEVGTFRKTSGNWEEFTFEPVEALFVKLTCESGNSQWQQIGEFEVYEQISVPDIAGSIITASSSHIANGYDASTVQIYLADANGNPVAGLSPSYFRLSATGTQNMYSLVTETEQPGVYVGALSSLTPEDKTVAVRIGGTRLASSSLTTATPVMVKFTEPELTKETLVVDDGSQTWRGEGWDKAVDGNVNTQVAAINKYSGCYGIYKFADDGERAILKVRLFRGTGNGYPQQLVKEYRVSTSTDGTNFKELFKKSTSATDWEEKLTVPVMAKYIKLELLDSDDNYRALSEFEVYTTPLIGAGPNAFARAAFDANKKAIPTKYALGQNYPNPFNPETMITFDLPEQAKVSLQVYNLMGQTIRTLVNENKPAGSYRIQWDGKDDHGKAVASGVYFYQIKAIGNTKTFSQKMKMMLVR
ncbi:MAG: discoidin domain-containing protein [candidate division KSB1 bacterium]|nr:discoidin domain-containing protein [candidate division KSB1 bacterium]